KNISSFLRLPDWLPAECCGYRTDERSALHQGHASGEPEVLLNRSPDPSHFARSERPAAVHRPDARQGIYEHSGWWPPRSACLLFLWHIRYVWKEYFCRQYRNSALIFSWNCVLSNRCS